jgi:hypothetical protein
MRYYRFNSSTKASCSPPVQTNGEPFPIGGPYARHANSVRVWVPFVPDFNPIKSADKLTDFLGFRAIEHVISPTVRPLLEQFRLDAEFRFIPADVVSWHTRDCLAHYFYCPPTPEHNVLNRERAKVILWSTRDAVQKIIEWEIDNDRLPPLDLFRVDDGHWLATEPLVQSLLDHKLTGWGVQAVWDTTGRMSRGTAELLSGYGPKLRRAIRKIQIDESNTNPTLAPPLPSTKPQR